MSKLKIAGLALIAVFAFSVVAAASASAAPEWLANGAAITSALPATITGELELEDTNVLGSAVSIKCSGSFKGTIGPGATDLITEVEGKAGEKTTLAGGTPVVCAFVNKGPCETAMTPLALALHLDWSTELTLETRGTEDLYVDLIKENVSEKEGLPGWEVLECLVLGLSEGDACTGNTGADVKNTATDVEGEFLGKTDAVVTPAATCSLGGGVTGLLQSLTPGLITLNEGATLQVSG